MGSITIDAWLSLHYRVICHVINAAGGWVICSLTQKLNPSHNHAPWNLLYVVCVATLLLPYKIRNNQEQSN